MTAKKCTKKRDARAQLLLCLFNPLPFLWSRCRCPRGILNSLSTHAIRNLSSTTERLIFPTLFLPYFPGWWLLPKARGLRFPAFPDELSWSLVPLKYHYPSLLTLTNFLVEYFQYYCSVDLPMFSWFLYLVQSIKFDFQDVLVLAKKPFGWKIPHSSDVIFPRTDLFPKEKGYSHCKVSSTIEKCDLRLPRWQFLDLLETTIYIVEPWKKRMGYCFVHECIHAQGSHKCQFYVFFCHDLPDNGMLRSGNFATMATWCNDFSSLLVSIWA